MDEFRAFDEALLAQQQDMDDGETPEQKHMSLDTNGDGKLSMEELFGDNPPGEGEMASIEKTIQASDKDGDGLLDIDEFRALDDAFQTQPEADENMPLEQQHSMSQDTDKPSNTSDVDPKTN